MGRYINLLNNIDLLFKKKIVIYGTGSTGKRMYTLLNEVKGKEIFAGFCTSNPDDWGKAVDGLEILSLDRVREGANCGKYNIVIASVYFYEILEYIKLVGIKLDTVYMGKMVEWGVFFAWKRKELSNKGIKWFEEQYESWKRKTKEGCQLYDESYCIENMKGIIEGKILVYQPAKVGSRSVHDSLIKCGVPALHIHEIPSVVKRVNKKSLTELYNIAKEKRPIKIITMIREPIGRDISQFFQLLIKDRLWCEQEIFCNNLVKTFYSFIENIYGIEIVNDKLHTDIDLTNGTVALSAIVGNQKKYGYEFDWFNQEIKQMFDIDIYQYPFDKTLGYSCIEKNGIQILIITLEHLSACETIIKEKLGIDNFRLLKSNVADMKEYADLYQEFKEELVFDKRYLEFYYNDNLAVNHFYSVEEQKTFMRKWTKNVILESE